MKRKILTLALTTTFSITLFSQEVNFTEKFDSIFGSVRFDTISSGILYNRVAKFATNADRNRLSNLIQADDVTKNLVFNLIQLKK